jgi:ParB family chromosome partitioning protein
MSDRSKIAAASKNIVFVPLNKLKKWPKNVRKVPHTKADIQAFAASIAAIGMLQYPVVEPEIGPKGKPTGNYLVNVGEGRRLAQLLRVKRKEIKPDEPIRCILDTEHSATEISLVENAVRSDMHLADQYEAFAKLHDEQGKSAEDIAARFGVTAAVVSQARRGQPQAPGTLPQGRDESRPAIRLRHHRGLSSVSSLNSLSSLPAFDGLSWLLTPRSTVVYFGILDTCWTRRKPRR